MSDQRARAMVDHWIQRLAGDEYADSFLGDPSRISTTDVASMIAEHFRRRQPARVFQNIAFSIGTRGIQGDEARPGRGPSAPDVSYITPDGWRANLEVDDQASRSSAHEQAHLAVVRRALRVMGPAQATCLLARTQSTFVRVNAARLVTHVRRVRYRVDGSVVTAVLATNDGPPARARVDAGKLPSPMPVLAVLAQGLLNRQFLPVVTPPTRCQQQR